MRLSELVTSEVFDRNGEHVGHVHDVRLIQGGPPMGTWGAALRVEGLVVGRGAIGTRLGTTSPRMKGPWILKALFARQRASRVIAPWEQVQSVDDNRVTLRCLASECREIFRAEDTDIPT
jgi:sporulation protein YlmC with PRC-barrel domain